MLLCGKSLLNNQKQHASVHSHVPVCVLTVCIHAHISSICLCLLIICALLNFRDIDEIDHFVKANRCVRYSAVVSTSNALRAKKHVRSNPIVP